MRGTEEVELRECPASKNIPTTTTVTSIVTATRLRRVAPRLRMVATGGREGVMSTVHVVPARWRATVMSMGLINTVISTLKPKVC